MPLAAMPLSSPTIINSKTLAVLDAFALFIEFNTTIDNNFTQIAIVNDNGGGNPTTPEPTSVISLITLGLLGFASAKKRK